MPAAKPFGRSNVQSGATQVPSLAYNNGFKLLGSQKQPAKQEEGVQHLASASPFASTGFQQQQHNILGHQLPPAAAQQQAQGSMGPPQFTTRQQQQQQQERVGAGANDTWQSKPSAPAQEAAAGPSEEANLVPSPLGVLRPLINQPASFAARAAAFAKAQAAQEAARQGERQVDAGAGAGAHVEECEDHGLQHAAGHSMELGSAGMSSQWLEAVGAGCKVQDHHVVVCRSIVRSMLGHYKGSVNNREAQAKRNTHHHIYCCDALLTLTSQDCSWQLTLTPLPVPMVLCRG